MSQTGKTTAIRRVADREMASLGIMGDHLGASKTPQTITALYRIEEFKGGLNSTDASLSDTECKFL